MALAVAPDGTTYLAGIDETTICDDPTRPRQPSMVDIGGSGLIGGIAIGESGLPFVAQDIGPLPGPDPTEGRTNVVECLDASCGTIRETVIEGPALAEGLLGPIGGPNGPSAVVYRKADPAGVRPLENVVAVWDDDPATADHIAVATGDAAGGLTFLPVAATIGPDQRPTMMWGRDPAEGTAGSNGAFDIDTWDNTP